MKVCHLLLCKLPSYTLQDRKDYKKKQFEKWKLEKKSRYFFFNYCYYYLSITDVQDTPTYQPVVDWLPTTSIHAAKNHIVNLKELQGR